MVEKFCIIHFLFIIYFFFKFIFYLLVLLIKYIKLECGTENCTQNNIDNKFRERVFYSQSNEQSCLGFIEKKT